MKYLVELKAVLSLPDDRTIMDLADANLRQALANGLVIAGVPASVSSDYDAWRGISLLDEIGERRIKRLGLKKRSRA